MKNSFNQRKPNLPKRLFWEYRFDSINWKREADSIIDRVIERGTVADWDELIRFYGMAKVLDTVKNKIRHLPDEVIADVCKYFSLKPRELSCYTGKQSKPRHWN